MIRQILEVTEVSNKASMSSWLVSGHLSSDASIHVNLYTTWLEMVKTCSRSSS